MKVLISFALSFACSTCLLPETGSSHHAPSTPQPSPFRRTPASNQREPAANPINENWSNKYTFTTTSQATTVAGAEVNAEYPSIDAAFSPRLKTFNKWIRARVLAHVARFEHLARINNRNGQWIEMGLDLSYEVFYSDETIISLRLTHHVMEAGQMHPIGYFETINYDIRKCRQLRAPEIFKRGYLKVFSSYSRKRLTEAYEIPNQEWFEKGTAPITSNFGNWNIVHDGILISFEDYQVSSHSFGQPQLVVPFSELRRVILKRSLASRVSKLGRG